jgi:hypothetical protein
VAEYIANLYRVDPEWEDWEETDGNNPDIGAGLAGSVSGAVPGQPGGGLDTPLFAPGSAVELLPPLPPRAKSRHRRVRFHAREKRTDRSGEELSTFGSPLAEPDTGMDSSGVSPAALGPRLPSPTPSSDGNTSSFFSTLFSWGGRAAAEAKADQLKHEKLVQMLMERDYPPDHPAYLTQQKMKQIQREREAQEELRRQQLEAERQVQHQKDLELSRLPKSWSIIQGWFDDESQTFLRLSIAEMFHCYCNCLYIADELFNWTHVAVLSAIFREFGADWNTMLLDPEQLESVFNALALPTNAPELQRAIKHTLVVSENKIGFLKFCRYVLRNARRLCKRYRIERMRIMADLLLHPPIEEVASLRCCVHVPYTCWSKRLL